MTGRGREHGTVPGRTPLGWLYATGLPGPPSRAAVRRWRRSRRISKMIGSTEMNTISATTGRIYLSISSGLITLVICSASR